jgi:hypothetical protein
MPIVWRQRCVVAAVTLVSVLPASVLVLAQARPITDTSRGLMIQLSDGRASTRALRPTGGVWMPKFPRVPGAETSKNGLPLSTLDLRYFVEGADVVVVVSLSYGGPTKNLVKVATARVSPETAVQVNELRAHGVEPITLSIVAIPSAPAFTPVVTSVSAYLDVRIEAIGPNRSAYRVTLTNRSNLAMMWMRYLGSSEGKPMISSRPRGKRNLPLVPAGGEHTFDIRILGSNLAPGDPRQAWRPLDTLAIQSLMWEDGLVEGDREIAKGQGRFDAARSASLSAFLAVLRTARAESLGSLTSRIERTMDADAETREARDAVLADLESLKTTGRSRGGVEFEAWIKRTIDEHQQWLSRIVLPKF